jgi:isoquinoline 1-oxidoreductase beta subunit
MSDALTKLPGFLRRRSVNRRGFLQSAAAAGGALVIGVYVPELDPQAAGQEASAGQDVPTFKPNAFVRIGTDDSVTVIVNHSEMGQGTMTSLPMLVAEELDANWERVRAEHAPVDPAYNHTQYGIQMVGGSTSVRTEWDRLRKAGATARAMLVAAAAAEWGVEASACSTANGEVVHAASGKRAKYGSLVEAASKLAAPSDVKLKDPKDFKLIGKPTRRLDTPEKVNGKGVFGLDVTLPGMLVAVIARPPVFGGSVKSFDATKAGAVPGVRRVVQIARGVAVVADGFWPAKLGREALEIEWDDGLLGSLDSDTQRDEYAAMAEKPGAVAKRVGDADNALADAATKVEAVYELPYLAHATMEPINCVADVRADRCDVYTGTQFQTADHAAAVEITGLAPDKVKVHTMLLGGGFGRKAVIDSHFVREAVELSTLMNAPVKVVWTREDDTRGGYYRPAAHHKMVAGFDAAGEVTALRHAIVCQSFIAGTPFEAVVIKSGVDDTAVEGAADSPYAIPNVLVDWREAPGGVPTLWWRSVGHSHTAFAVESFIDELAHAAGKDPLEYRVALLKDHPRHAAAVRLVAEKIGWGSAPPEGRGRGFAVHESFGSIIAHAIEASVADDGKVHVHKVVCAVDCGPIVNPDTIRAQMEGATAFGLTAALYGKITFANGRVQQRNFHDYAMLRMHEMPEVETHIISSTAAMGGVGEPGVPSVAPALANAIFAATGKRVRRLPVSVDELRRA